MIIEEDIFGVVKDLGHLVNQLKNHRVLVTGSTGHIGYYFSQFLLKSNKLLNLNLEITLASKGELQKSFEEYKNDFIHLKGDILEKDFFADLGEYDCVLHFAGYAQPSIFIADPISTIKMNTEIVSSLLKKVSLTGSFLFLSSSEIYENSISDLALENFNGCVHPNHPRAPYILSKLLGESICLNELDNTKKNIKIARLSMVYGPGIRKNDTRAISQFLYQGLINKKIILLDQGVAQREYLYISDAIRALVNVLLTGKDTVYNIGSGSAGSITIFEVAKKIANLCNVDLVVPKDDRNLLGARKIVELQVSKYESEFGLTLKINFESGIERTFNWVKSEWMN